MQSPSRKEESIENCESPNNAFFNFMYALKASETKRQYPKRLEVFLDYLKLKGSTIEEKADEFYKFASSNPKDFQKRLLNYIVYHKGRAKSGEISESTVPNYYKPIKLFCDMNDIVINWKIVTRGIPKGRHAAEDRIPTMDEIKKLMEYPDVRIKSILLTMISSGIRLGAWDFLKWKHIIHVIKSHAIRRKKKTNFIYHHSLFMLNSVHGSVA